MMDPFAEVRVPKWSLLAALVMLSGAVHMAIWEYSTAPWEGEPLDETKAATAVYLGWALIAVVGATIAWLLTRVGYRLLVALILGVVLSFVSIIIGLMEYVAIDWLVS